MILFNRHNLTMRSAHNTVTWTFTDTDTERNACVTEIFYRTHAGLYYVRQPAAGEADPAALALLAYRAGALCTRPFTLMQPHDSANFYCLIGLFASCCRAWNLQPTELLRTADARNRVTETDLLLIKQHARWEGTAFPGTWDAPTVSLLCDSLGDLGLASTAALLRTRTLKASGY